MRFPCTPSLISATTPSENTPFVFIAVNFSLMTFLCKKSHVASHVLSHYSKSLSLSAHALSILDEEKNPQNVSGGSL